MATHDLEHYEDALRNIRRRGQRAVGELHPDLQFAVLHICTDMDYRVTPWTGHRDAEGQRRAWLAGHSNAYAFGKSPHNYRPALACDLVLNPARVPVRERGNTGWPDLWDNDTPEARKAWEDLTECAARYGLERVRIRRHRHTEVDRPHVQMPNWRRLAGLETDGD